MPRVTCGSYGEPCAWGMIMLAAPRAAESNVRARCLPTAKSANGQKNGFCLASMPSSNRAAAARVTVTVTQSHAAWTLAVHSGWHTGAASAGGCRPRTRRPGPGPC